jgi:hypothetical protein
MHTHTDVPCSCGPRVVLSCDGVAIWGHICARRHRRNPNRFRPSISDSAPDKAIGGHTQGQCTCADQRCIACVWTASVLHVYRPEVYRNCTAAGVQKPYGQQVYCICADQRCIACVWTASVMHVYRPEVYRIVQRWCIKSLWTSRCTAIGTHLQFLRQRCFVLLQAQNMLLQHRICDVS